MLSRTISFWRCQLIGWTICIFATFPLKFAIFGNFTHALAATFLREGIGFLLTLGLWRIYRRWNREAFTTPRLIAAILGMSIATAAVETLLVLLIQYRSPLLPPHSRSLIFLVGTFCYRTMLFAFWSLLYFWIKDWNESQTRERRLAQTEIRRQEAELQMLRAQVNPHFLFNALNTIQSGLNRDQEPLKKVVLGLADYLRYSLANQDRPMVPLGEEFDAILQYLEVEKARFRGDLTIDAHIDESARHLPVPGIMLQPLVENAIRYGLEDSIRPLHVHIAACRGEKGRLDITVSNTGHWIEPRGRRADGTGGSGLDTLRRRLALLYPGKHDLKIKSEADQVTVTIRLELEVA